MTWGASSPTAPATTKSPSIRIRPPPGKQSRRAPINWVKTHYDSVHAGIASNWLRTENKFELENGNPGEYDARLSARQQLDTITEGGKSLGKSRRREISPASKVIAPCWRWRRQISLRLQNSTTDGRGTKKFFTLSARSHDSCLPRSRRKIPAVPCRRPTRWAFAGRGGRIAVCRKPTGSVGIFIINHTTRCPTQSATRRAV